MKASLTDQLLRVERLAKTSKARRFLARPSRYIAAQFHAKIWYRLTKKGKLKSIQTFYGQPMEILIPSSTDLYLTGGKTHDSEIRLARYLIQQLKPGSSFLDVGAHYGYFSLLAATLVGPGGTVHAIEPASEAFQLLQHNLAQRPNAQAHQLILSDENKLVDFFEFPNHFSEYNALDIDQYREEAWFNQQRPTVKRLTSTTLDTFLEKRGIPEIIKIDVEGAEHLVIKGGQHLFKAHHPTVIMEYLHPDRQNDAHQAADDLLKDAGFTSHLIGKHGTVEEVPDINDHLIQRSIDSENVVYLKFDA